ncbi:unnamed protein product [Effrenium voratum]|nr:unnamed protein product [Effrenium voratum]
MVIPMQTPAIAGHFPAPTDAAVLRMKYCIVGVGVSFLGRLLTALLQGLLGSDFFGALNMLLSFTCGIFMFKEEERFKFAAIYQCLASSLCQTCAAQGMGGTQCLMPFMMLSVINCIMDLFLRLPFLAILPYGLFILTGLISQAAGAYYAWTAYKVMRDLEPTDGTEMSGGFALQGDQPAEASQGSSFTPFTGSGNRLGG